MNITIDSKVYDMNKWEIVDSINYLPCKDFIYFTETLYKTVNDEFIMNTQWMLNPERNKMEIEDGTITEDDLEPKEAYQVMSNEKANEWMEKAIWYL